MGMVLAVFVGKIETGKVYGPFGERVRLVVDQIEKVEEKAKPRAGQNPSALADKQLRATPEQLCDALGACTDLKPVYRRLLKMALEQLQFLEQQIGQLDQETASLLRQHQDAVERLAEVPGLGVDSASQIIAEVGATAATFLRRSSLPRGWAPAPATRRVRAEP
jgi:transposase